MSAFRLIEAEKAKYPICLMCRMLGVSRSGYHAWRCRAPSDRQLSDAWLVGLIRQIHSENRGCMARRGCTLSCAWLMASVSGASAWSG